MSEKVGTRAPSQRQVAGQPRQQLHMTGYGEFPRWGHCTKSNPSKAKHAFMHLLAFVSTHICKLYLKFTFKLINFLPSRADLL